MFNIYNVVMLKYMYIVLTVLLISSSAYLFNVNKVLRLQLSDLRAKIKTEELPRGSENVVENENATLLDNIKNSYKPFSAVLIADTFKFGQVCNSESCFLKRLDPGQFENKYFGYTTFKGFYSSNEEEAYGKKVKCDYFNVIYDKPDLILGSLLGEYEWVTKSKDNLVAVRIDISTGGVSEQEKERIQQSTASKPVRITVFRDFPAPIDSDACSSLFYILGVR